MRFYKESWGSGVQRRIFTKKIVRRSTVTRTPGRRCGLFLTTLPYSLLPFWNADNPNEIGFRIEFVGIGHAHIRMRTRTKSELVGASLTLFGEPSWYTSTSRAHSSGLTRLQCGKRWFFRHWSSCLSTGKPGINIQLAGGDTQDFASARILSSVAWFYVFEWKYYLK